MSLRRSRKHLFRIVPIFKLEINFLREMRLHKDHLPPQQSALQEIFFVWMEMDTSKHTSCLIFLWLARVARLARSVSSHLTPQSNALIALLKCVFVFLLLASKNLCYCLLLLLLLHHYHNMYKSFKI